MAEMPEPMNTTASLIYRAYETGGGQAMADFRKQHGVPEPDDGLRAHLGASLIGRECRRELWLKFRWAARPSFDGRMLRLFETGHLEEPRLVANLRAIGVIVHDKDPEGVQWKLRAIGGHFGGSMDSALLNVPEAPKTWHVGEYKTASEKVFAEIVKKGVKAAKPEHYAQCMTYMGLTGMDRALYAVKNKNTDALHIERLEFNEAEFKALMDKAEAIINAVEPPTRISEDPSFYKCKICDFHDQCHGQQVPLPTCRSCAHSTPEMSGDGLWSCAKHNAVIPIDVQKVGCPSHRYIPVLLGRIGQMMNGDNDEVSYRKPDGTVFVNGEGKGAYWSAEIHAAEDKGSIGHPVTRSLKERFGAKVTA
jgi:CRISPR/Cas system-associated exonuclease Cas4 (RecB family)